MSGLETALSGLASRIAQYSETIQTEEAVKTSVVLPFLQSLGYDVFNPSEVVPEYTADAVGKRGEKVDYAIMRNGEVSILIECKGMATSLNEKHLAQLYRYFSVTNARFAILTNGREYHFHSDLDESNRLDKRSFFVFDLLDYSNQSVIELEKFANDTFDVENILAQAERLKYVSSIKKVLSAWMNSAPEPLIKLIAGEVYDGRVNSEVRAMIGSGVKAAFAEIVRDRVRSRLNTALDEPLTEGPPDESSFTSTNEVVTTEEEIEGWITVKSVLRGKIEGSRIVMRDAKSYCAVLLDDNNRKPIVRLHFNRARKFIGLFDGDGEDKLPISSLDDLLGFSDRIKATVDKYE